MKKTYYTINKIVHYKDDNMCIASKGINIYVSKDNENSWERLFSLPVSFFTKIKNKFKLSKRLFREGIHHIILFKNIITVFAGKYIYKYNITTKEFIDTQALTGSRPLCVAITKQGDILYGEYTGNKERKSIRIFKNNYKEKTWEEIYKLKNIRHIHGIFYDEFTDSIWFTTGDYNEEIGIWNTSDNFVTVSKVLGNNSQQYRTVQLLFTKKYVYFGSDTPLEKNYIYRMDRLNKRIERLQEVSGSIFYGYNNDKKIFFSTVCEPSNVNVSSDVELWISENGKDWYKEITLKKDIWNKKIFQYGQIKFPYQKHKNNYIWITPYAVKKYDQKSLKIQL